MKKLSLALSLAFGVATFAEVPALINYQGRLVDGVGNPITGPKDFKLDIYDSQTEGTLIYQETLADITLDEDGAYSFQFGAGESRTETSAVIATGDGSSAFFQYVFEQTPVGVISVTDGTNTFTSEDTPTGEESFSFTYTSSLKRINLVSNEPPAEGTKFTATFRYAESGIVGALGSAAEHWMELTIGDEKQSPRQRLVAVPFALRAGISDRVKEQGEAIPMHLIRGGDEMHQDSFFSEKGIPSYAKKLISINVVYDGISDKSYPAVFVKKVLRSEFHDYKLGLLSQNELSIKTVWSANRIQEFKMDFDEGASIDVTLNKGFYWGVKIDFGEGLALDPEFYYFFTSEDLPVGNNYSGGRAQDWYYKVVR